MEFIHGEMGEDMRDIILMIRNQARGFIHGPTEEDMTENGSKENSKFL